MSNGEARKLAAAVSRLIELDTMDLTRKARLSEDEFYERIAVRNIVDAAKNSEDPFVQGILAPLKCWDEQP